MKESAKPRTGARSGKGKSATKQSTRGKGFRVLTVILENSRYYTTDFSIAVEDIVDVEKYEWGNDEYRIKYKSLAGLVSTSNEFGSDDKYKIDGEPATFERVKMILENMITKNAIEDLPEN